MDYLIFLTKPCDKVFRYRMDCVIFRDDVTDSVLIYLCWVRNSLHSTWFKVIGTTDARVASLFAFTRPFSNYECKRSGFCLLLENSLVWVHKILATV